MFGTKSDRTTLERIKPPSWCWWTPPCLLTRRRHPTASISADTNDSIPYARWVLPRLCCCAFRGCEALIIPRRDILSQYWNTILTIIRLRWCAAECLNKLCSHNASAFISGCPVFYTTVLYVLLLNDHAGPADSCLIFIYRHFVWLPPSICPIECAKKILNQYRLLSNKNKINRINPKKGIYWSFPSLCVCWMLYLQTKHSVMIPMDLVRRFRKRSQLIRRERWYLL